MKRGLLVFILCVAGDLLAGVLMHRQVMTDQVYVAMLGIHPTEADVEGILRTIRRWNLILLALGPLVLLLRTGGTALLVQLLLMALRARGPLPPIFVASLRAQLVLVLGRIARGLAFISMPPEARTAASLSEPLLMLGRLFTFPDEWAVALRGIERMSLLSVAWCVVFTIALRGPDQPRLMTRAGAVAGTALLIGTTRWVGWLYLTGLGAPSITP